MRVIGIYGSLVCLVTLLQYSTEMSTLGKTFFGSVTVTQVVCACTTNRLHFYMLKQATATCSEFIIKTQIDVDQLHR